MTLHEQLQQAQQDLQDAEAARAARLNADIAEQQRIDAAQSRVAALQQQAGVADWQAARQKHGELSQQYRQTVNAMLDDLEVVAKVLIDALDGVGVDVTAAWDRVNLHRGQALNSQHRHLRQTLPADSTGLPAIENPGMVLGELARYEAELILPPRLATILSEWMHRVPQNSPARQYRRALALLMSGVTLRDKDGEK